MKSNTTHNPPITPIENLGDGTFYYNFDVVHSVIQDDEGYEYDNYDYEQVRCSYPIDIDEIQEEVNKEGYDHKVEL